MRISAGVQTCALPIWSWRVSAAALAIGTAAYRHWDWITDMRQTLHADAAALDAVLARHGFMAIGDCPLFRLIQTEQAAVLFDNLARHAILTRPFDYNSRWLRLGLPGSDQRSEEHTSELQS